LQMGSCFTSSPFRSSRFTNIPNIISVGYPVADR
jgi:hypothetical protein